MLKINYTAEYSSQRNLFFFGLICVFFAALACLLFYVKYLGLNNLYYSSYSIFLNDSLEYINTARSFVDHKHLVSSVMYPQLITDSSSRLYMPGYYLVLATFFYFFGATSLAALLPSMVAYVLSSVLIYSSGKKLYGQKVGVLASLFFMMTPLVLLYSVSAMSELTLVLVCLLIFYAFICTPQKAKLFLLPLLLAIPFMFRQTTFLMMFVLSAAYLQSEKITKEKIFFLLVSLITTGFILSLLTKWQVNLGMKPFFSDIKITNISAWFGKLLINLVENAKVFGAGYKENIYSGALAFCTITFSYLLFFPAVLLFYYGCKKFKTDRYPLFLSAQVAAILLLTLITYTGAFATVMRMCLFVYPFVLIVFSHIILKLGEKTKPQGMIVGNIVKFISISAIAFFLLLYFRIYYDGVHIYQNNLEQLVKYSKLREDFIKNNNLNDSKVVIAPLELSVIYLSKHYPIKVFFYPMTDIALELINNKYPIDTIVVTPTDLTKTFTKAAINKIGLVQVGDKYCDGSEYIIFKHQLF